MLVLPKPPLIGNCSRLLQRQALLAAILLLAVVFLAVNNNCLTAAKCENTTNGTIQQGNQINGKYKSAMLGWSNANF